MKRKFEELEEKLLKYRTKQKKLEEKYKQLEAKLQEGPAVAGGDTQGVGGTDAYQDAVKNFSEQQYREVLKTLALKVFTKEELAKRSISGKKCAKSGETPRLPLDQEKMALLEKLFLDKCPTMNHKIFMEKLQNIQKVLRRDLKC